MVRARWSLFWASLAVGVAVALAGESNGKGEVSFKADVFPVIDRHCLPCHAEEQFNKSELSLDTYSLLMAGGKHGVPVVPGKPEESILLRKLSDNPPFGDPMPLDPRWKEGQPRKKRLSDREIQILTEWVREGAKDN